MLTWNSWIHMTMPSLASGTKVQTRVLLGSSRILICSEQSGGKKKVNASQISPFMKKWSQWMSLFHEGLQHSFPASMISGISNVFSITYFNSPLVLYQSHTHTIYSKPYIHKLPAKWGFACVATTWICQQFRTSTDLRLLDQQSMQHNAVYNKSG